MDSVGATAYSAMQLHFKSVHSPFIAILCVWAVPLGTHQSYRCFVHTLQLSLKALGGRESRVAAADTGGRGARRRVGHSNPR